MIDRLTELEARVANLEEGNTGIYTITEARINDLRREIYNLVEREVTDRAHLAEFNWLRDKVERLNKTVLLYEKLIRDYLPYIPEDMNLEEIL